ncbi:HDOD domain-containing protein [bacterium]|nr:HDOD domain-containing protein [bacterium]
MKTIAYTCSYEENINKYTEEITKQSADIKNFCKIHNIELDEIFTETSTREDFKPVLLNIMSKFYNTAERLIITNNDVISKNKDFKDWVFDEFNRMKIEIISLNKEPEIQTKKSFSSLTENIKNIPSLPEIITKSIELMQDKNTSAATLSKIISNDIGLTARVLKLVNSAYYGFPKQISTIQQAITILGFTTIKGIILSASIYKMFSQNGTNNYFNYKKFWKHSLLVAKASGMLATEAKINTQEDIFAAAFLHDIGKIIFAQYDRENYSNVYKSVFETDEEYMKAEEKYCGLTHCEIANMVAYSWNLPEIFCDIITYHHTPNKSEHYKTECSAVYIANEITKSLEGNKNLNIYNIPSDILEKLNISEDNINSIHCKLNEIAIDLTDIDSFFE